MGAAHDPRRASVASGQPVPYTWKARGQGTSGHKKSIAPGFGRQRTAFSQYRASGCEPGQGPVTIGAWSPAAETGEVPCSQEAHTQKTSAGALIGRFNSHSNRCDSSESGVFRPDPWRHPHLLGRRHQADPRGQRRQAWGVARRPSCTRGPAPDVGRTSRSTLCVLRRKRTRRVWRSNVVARINVKSR